MRRHACVLFGLLLALSPPVRADTGALQEAERLMEAGALWQADTLLRLPAGADAATQQAYALARMNLLLPQRRSAEAQALQDQWLPLSRDAARVRWLLAAGRLHEQQARPESAQGAYQEAVALAMALQPAQAPLQQRARLQALRLSTDAAALAALEPQLSEPGLLIELGQLALRRADAATALRAFERARRSGGARQQAQALEGLAALYEADQRPDEARTLTLQGLQALEALPEALRADLRVLLEFRLARLQAGQPAASLAAYQRAVDQLERVRNDWPIETEDGQSTHAKLFQPLYLGLVDGLLRQAHERQNDAALLRRAREAIEQLHQAEIQDYLGDRCEVDAIKGGASVPLPAGAAAIYPVLLPDRVELLVEDAQGLSLVRSPSPPGHVRQAAALLAKQLRERASGYERLAQVLHQALLAPLEPWLAERRIDTLVWVSDGPLRLIPMGVLFDGQRFALERWNSVSTLGLSMTNTQQPVPGARLQTLLAGTAQFGPVVQRLTSESWAQGITRSLGSGASGGVSVTPAVQEARLRDALALPGVTDELDSLGRLTGGTTLRDTHFTVQGFGQALQTGGHRVVHLASHGVFGGSAASSYLLAYDDLLTLSNLQSLLLSEGARRKPIELLSLSACQTAEGNERAPLGIAGAAIKARARAVLGSLWPVDDAATGRLMAGFYSAWLQRGLGKAGALREAQLLLLRDPASRHPYFWAPFTLIGNWL